jgi:hypothetical protein
LVNAAQENNAAFIDPSDFNCWRSKEFVNKMGSNHHCPE